MPWPSVPPPPPAPADSGAGLKGATADAAEQLDDALQKNHSAVNDADAQLTDAILRATASDQQGKDRLRGLQQSITDEVKKLGPSLDAAAGQQQLADFLQGKTAEILDVVKSAGLDSSSHAAVLDALAARFRAVGDNHAGGSDDGSASGPSEPPSTAAAAAPAGGAPAADPPGNDQLLNGLPADPLIDGLGPLAGPGFGALGGLPAMMGSMLPSGGGMGGAGMGGVGLPLGDLGSSIGGAIRDAVHDSASTDDKPDPLKNQRTNPGRGPDTAEAAPLKDQNGDPAPKPPVGSGSPPTGASSGAAAPPPPDASVALPDGTAVTADSPAVAKAGKAVLGGADITDAYQQAGIALSAPGTPVAAPVSPPQLVFGDIGQFTDHRVMALGGGKAWVNGQVTPLEQLDTGPNFLGWEHPDPLSTGAEVSAGSRQQREVR